MINKWSWEGQWRVIGGALEGHWRVIGGLVGGGGYTSAPEVEHIDWMRLVLQNKKKSYFFDMWLKWGRHIWEKKGGFKKKSL